MLNSIALIIQQKAAEAPEKLAITVGDESCNYGLLAKMNRKAARYLQENGIKEGDTVHMYGVEFDYIK